MGSRRKMFLNYFQFHWDFIDFNVNTCIYCFEILILKYLLTIFWKVLTLNISKLEEIVIVPINSMLVEFVKPEVITNKWE